MHPELNSGRVIMLSFARLLRKMASLSTLSRKGVQRWEQADAEPESHAGAVLVSGPAFCPRAADRKDHRKDHCLKANPPSPLPDAHRVLRESEEPYRSLFEHMLDGCAYCQMLFDEQGGPDDFVYLAVNEAFGRLTGLKNVVGKRATEVIPRIKELNPELFEIYGRVASTTKPERFEIDFKPLGLYLSVSAYCPEPGHFVAVFDDISERKQAELRLRQAKEEWERTFDSVPDPIAVLDRAHRVRRVNRAMADRLGVTPEQCVGLHCHEAVHGLGAPPAFCPHMLTCADGQTHTVEVHEERLGGHFLVTATPLRDEQGRVLGSVHVARDITARKRAEEALRASHERLKKVLEVETVGVMFWDLKTGYLTDANDTFLKMTGYSRGDLEAHLLSWQKFAPPEYQEVGLVGIRKFQATGRVGPYEKEHVRKDGARQWLLFAGSSLGDDTCVEFCVDISAQKNAEAALQKAHDELEKRIAERTAQLNQTTELARAERQRFYHVLETLPAYVCLMTPDYRIAFANRIFREWFGHSLNRKCYEFLFDHDQPCERCQTYSVLKTNAPHRWEWTGPNGRTYDVFDFPFIDTDGARLILEMGIDITERKQAEKALQELNETLEQRVAQRTAELRQSREDLDRAQAVGQIGWWRLDTRKNVLTWSPESHRIFGVPEGTPMSYESFLSIVHPDDRRYVDTRWQAALRGEPYDLEHRIVANGHVKWVREKAYLEFDSDRKLLGGFGITQDITARKTAEEALRRSEEFLRRVIDTVPSMIFIKDWEGRFVLVNEALARTYGTTTAEIIGKTDADFNANTEEVEHFRRDDREVMSTRCTKIIPEEPVTHPDGEVRWYSTVKVPLVKPDGTSAWVLGVASDITARKQAEEELKAAKVSAEQARAIAESANKAKDQFIAVLSHELRTPLTPAVAALSLLRTDSRLPSDVHEDLEMISRNLNLEVRLIADLLDVSRIISGKLHLDKRPADVAVAIREAAKIVSGDLDAKGQTLAIETPGAPYLTLADGARLQQVFWNLLRNSIKFSPERSCITVRARLTPVEGCPMAAQPCPVGRGDCPAAPSTAGDQEPRPANLVVEVIDQGSGIHPDMLPRLFNPFEQDHKARSFGGLGLGLSICRAVVEMHGGTISAHSEGVGCGATFTVRLPIAQCQRPSPSEQPVRNPSGEAAETRPRDRALRILLVEDHADTAKLMRRLLMAEGYEVVTAGSVAEALAAAERHRPDVLISDLGLPDGSGLNLMAQLIARGQHIPGIALSGYGTPADLEQSRAAGFAEHLVKPLHSMDVVTAAIARLNLNT